MACCLEAPDTEAGPPAHISGFHKHSSKSLYKSSCSVISLIHSNGGCRDNDKHLPSSAFVLTAFTGRSGCRVLHTYIFYTTSYWSYYLLFWPQGVRPP